MEIVQNQVRVSRRVRLSRPRITPDQ
jgi:hypothetical protein